MNAEPFLLRKAKQSFYNTSPLDMKKLMGDQDHIRENLFAYSLTVPIITTGNYELVGPPQPASSRRTRVKL